MSRSTTPEFSWPESESVVLLGHRGMLGSLWVKDLRTGVAPSNLVTLDVDTCDMTDRDALETSIPSSSSVIINCAAYTNVDGAEEDEELATLVNGHAVGYLAELASERDALLVHYSTDYVFDGSATSPYATDTRREPCNAYGRSKALGEQLIERSGCEHLILRTSWLYAPHGNNFVRTIARLASARDELQIVDDQRGRPTSAQQLVRTSIGLIEARARGTFHTTDGGECSWYEFGKAICERVNPDCRVVPCSSDMYPRPAVRPSYSVLDISDTEQILGPIPHWREALGSVLTTMLEEDGAASSEA